MNPVSVERTRVEGWSFFHLPQEVDLDGSTSSFVPVIGPVTDSFRICDHRLSVSRS